MMGIRIFIATTEGPVAVESITRETAPRSVVCVKRSTSGALPISGAYHAFVDRSTGIVEECFGPFPEGSFRLDVAAPIDDGFSWQLGVFLAHAAQAAGVLAGSDEDAGPMVLATGMVDKDLKVGFVGHVVEKLHAAKLYLARWKEEGRRVVLLVPEANRADATAGLLGSQWAAAPELVSVADDAMALLGLTLRAAPDVASAEAVVRPAPPPRVKTARVTPMALAIVAGVAVGVAGAAVWLWRDAPKGVTSSAPHAAPAAPQRPAPPPAPAGSLDDSTRFPRRGP